jgi:hemoglobin
MNLFAIFRNAPLLASKSSTLLERLGGERAVNAAVDVFYRRLTEDEKTAYFFEGSDLEKLKGHQRNFMRMAFTKIPDGMDLTGKLIEWHGRLFQDYGLNGDHFDLIAGHFVGALQELNVPEEQVAEATSVVLPLRKAFEMGAEQAKEGKK